MPAVCLLALGLWAAPSHAASSETIKVDLTGAQQVPAVDSSGSGTATFHFNPTTRHLSWVITLTGLSGPATMAHLHGPAAAGANGKVEVSLTMKGAAPSAGPIKGSTTLTEDQAKDLTSGMLYVNVHTAAHPSGELRGQVVLPAS